MTTLTFDETPPRRPTLDDVGGAAFEDDTSAPPIAGQMPAADDFNQDCKLTVALSAVIYVAFLEVVFSGGTPSVANVVSPVSGVTTGTFTVQDNAAGDTSITWPAGTFPEGVLKPTGLTIVEDVAIDEARALKITNGVRVKTLDGAAGTDAGFTLLIMNQ